jgi:hypothetical protein
MTIENSTTQPTNGDTMEALSRTVNQFMELQSFALAARSLVIQSGGESNDVGATTIGMLARLSSKAAEFSSMADAADIAARKKTPNLERGEAIVTEIFVPPVQKNDFTASGKLYQFRPEARISDIQDQISAKQQHLEAALYVGSKAEFDCSDDVENFFWGCRMTAQEINMLTRELVRRLKSAEEVTA